VRILVAGATGVIGVRLVPLLVDAARQTLPALAVPPGVTIVADDRAAPAGG
jgi:hypothetical protein